MRFLLPSPARGAHTSYVFPGCRGFPRLLHPGCVLSVRPEVSTPRIGALRSVREISLACRPWVAISRPWARHAGLQARDRRIILAFHIISLNQSTETLAACFVSISAASRERSEERRVGKERTKREESY